MNPGIEYLDTEDLLELARRLLGEPLPLRDVGLLGAAAARPQASAFGEDAYPDVWTKAAALLHSIIHNHPLVDGNKRLGWLAAAVFLELNDASVATTADDDVYDHVMAVATGAADVAEIASALQHMHEQATPPTSAHDDPNRADQP
jgi:death-on-curing protein